MLTRGNWNKVSEYDIMKKIIKEKRSLKMVVLNPTKMVNFPADRDLADSARQIMKEKNLSQTEVFNLFLKNIVATGEINLLSEEELEKEAIFYQLQAEIKEGIDSYERGEGKSLAEVRAKLGV